MPLSMPPGKVLAYTPFSLVRGAKSSGHLVRQYEKSIKEVSPMAVEIPSCVVNHGPSNLATMASERVQLA